MYRLLCAVLVSGGFAFAAAPLYAQTERVPANASTKTGLYEMKPGVIAMAPIPDTAEAPSLAVTMDTMDDDADAGLARGKRASAKACLTTALYFEARGESLKGQKAVAEVILRRTRQPGRPKTVCGVVYEGSSRRTGCQFSFTCDGIADVVRDRAAWGRAKRAASAVLNSGGRARYSRGATHYHANYVMPYWAPSMRRVARVGTHVFYRE
jgi:spore germination cell wall hydrolase CwlJ-like protein